MIKPKKTLKEVMETLDSRLTSSNQVPVQQTRITKEEWEVLKQHLPKPIEDPDGDS